MFKMAASAQEKAFCMLEFAKTTSVSSVQQHFRTHYGKNPPLIRCPPPMPLDLTPYDFFLWGYMKDVVFVPPLPTDINDLKQHITEAVAAVSCDMLRQV
jgi:hypothetical protein